MNAADTVGKKACKGRGGGRHFAGFPFCPQSQVLSPPQTHALYSTLYPIPSTRFFSRTTNDVGCCVLRVSWSNFSFRTAMGWFWADQTAVPRHSSPRADVAPPVRSV